MNIRLVVTVPLSEGESKEFDYVFRQAAISIGRQPANDIPIPKPEVADAHAKILAEGETYRLVDLGSESGTRVDGRAIEPNEPFTLEEGAEIEIGGCTVLVTYHTGEVTDAVQEKTQQVAMQMVQEVLGALGGSGPCPHLEIINDEERGQTAELPDVGSEVLIGREQECQLKLSHWSVSRRHARIVRTRDEVMVEDLGSKNGVMLNDVVITGKQKIRDGDIVFVGHTQVRFHDPGDTLTDQLNDLPDPVAIDMKTSVIDLGPATEPPSPPASAPPPRTEPKAEPQAKEPPSPPASAPPPRSEPGAEVEPHTDDVPGGGLGDSLFLIIGIVVILGVAAAAVFLFAL